MSSDGRHPAFYTASESVLPAHHQVALLVELATSRNIREDRLLRNTGLFRSDICQATRKVSVVAFRRLIANVTTESKSPALDLLWGSQLFPGHYGPPSTLLAHSGNLMEFLQAIIRYRFLLCPFMAPHLVDDERWCYLYWTDAGGVGKARPFIAAAMIAGVRSATNWLSGETLPWQISFKRAAPDDTAEYRVAFGESVQFDTGIDLMRIERSLLFRPWAGKSELVRASAKTESDQLLAQAAQTHGLPEVVYEIMIRYPGTVRSLAGLSEYLGMSTATLKRRLKECGTSYQALYDETRLHVALHQFYVKGWSQEAVAGHLNCPDGANFRRMFKRWTGFTPADYGKFFRFR